MKRLLEDVGRGMGMIRWSIGVFYGSGITLYDIVVMDTCYYIFGKFIEYII